MYLLANGAVTLFLSFVCRKADEFCVVSLYPATLMRICISCESFLTASLGSVDPYPLQ